jgi:FkbM family methyltransferase
MQTRNGEEIAVFVRNKNGTRKELKQEELRTVPGGIHQNLGKIILKSIMELRVRNVYLLASIFTKKYILKTSYDEWNELIDWLHDCKAIEIDYRGKTIFFPQGGRYIPFIIDGIFVRNQYDVSDATIKDKIIIDAGANVGTFSILCAILGAKKIYAFEPVIGSCEMIRQNAKANGFDNIEVINKALSNVNTTSKIKMTYAGDGGASLDANNPGRVFQDVEVTTVDTFLNGERADFIKMDVEGNEEQVLGGALQTIRKYLPILSLSAYHKPTDKTVLPATLLAIEKGYGIKLLSYDDEVFYCKIKEPAHMLTKCKTCANTVVYTDVCIDCWKKEHPNELD